MKIIVYIFCVLSIVQAHAQHREQFEGKIEYRHRLADPSSVRDTSALYDALGRSSVFYFKNGNYKWIIYGKPIVTEYFDHQTQTIYFIFENNDTVYRSNKNGDDDSLLSLNPIKSGINVLGMKCKGFEAVTFTRKNPDSRLMRKIYYSDTAFVGSGVFTTYRSYANNIIYRKIENWPLRFEIETLYLPKFIMEAVSIVSRKLSDSEILVPPGRPKAQMPNTK